MPADSTILASLDNKWFNFNVTIDYKPPFKSSKAEFIENRWFHLEKLGNNFALYKTMQVLDKCELLKLPNASTASLNYKRYAVALGGAVLSYNSRTDAYDLKIVDYDDTSEYNLQYDSENLLLEGIEFENSLPKDTSGFVAYVETVGNVVPKCFETVDFMKLYKRIYCQQTKDE